MKKPWRYHGEPCALRGPAAKTLGACGPFGFGLWTSLGTTFTMIPPRLFQIMSQRNWIGRLWRYLTPIPQCNAELARQTKPGYPWVDIGSSGYLQTGGFKFSAPGARAVKPKFVSWHGCREINGLRLIYRYFKYYLLVVRCSKLPKSRACKAIILFSLWVDIEIFCCHSFPPCCTSYEHQVSHHRQYFSV